jgi:endonuclease-3
MNMNAEEKKRATRARNVNRFLKKEYNDATCALGFTTPLELLVATILSAQCTDKRVNMVTPSLFRKYTTAHEYAQADPVVFAEEIRSTGFFNNKTKSILGAAQVMVEKFGGEVPSSMEELLQLPGVARKTANIILGTAFGENEGIAVDTHVKRLSGRLGLSNEANPDKIEKDLMQVIPRKDWTDFSHRLITHGRQVCIARKPKCDECGMSTFCPFYNNETL